MKSSLRIDIKKRLNSISKEDKAKASEVIAKRLINSGVLNGNVCVYNSLPSEVDTKEIIDYCMKNCKLYMPVVQGDDMLFVRVVADTVFSLGAFDILQPIGEMLSHNQIKFDVCVTPMLAYDNQLNRLGKGKGYYDKFFANSKCIKIGLGFDQQNEVTVFPQPHDIKMDYIFTQTRTIQ